MKNGILKRRIFRVAGSASAVILLSGMLSGCKDDLLTGMPSWLGSSIYEELESRGNFTQTLKLINDLDEETGSEYARMLGLTGSKTVFVADDDSWNEFYKNNAWGVTCFEDLSLAQKKLLFKSNMINSAYLVELLGNIPAESDTKDPLEGSCMRRHSSTDISDSIPVLTADKFPVINPARVDATTGKQIDWWDEVRGRDSLIMFMDDNVATMIHFMPKFMQNNNITNEDVDFLTNHGIKSNTDAFINGKVIKEADVVCQNGYIHVTDGVPLPMDNMANVISTNPEFSIYSRLLDRFSYPEYSESMSARYGNGDSVFVKRYFNNHQSHKLTQTRKGDNAAQLLPYDPGWNEYIMYSASGTTYQYDAGMMLVPTDEAMRRYLDTDGSDLKERYGTAEANGYDAWDNAPDNVIYPLLENTMHVSLKSAIPSTFSTIMNTAAERIGVEEKDINKVHWACNGVIYETNKVYVAPDYVSVYYPCVIRGADDLHIMNTVVENDNKVAGGEGLKAYLNSMGTKYSFIIPTDNALGHYYDPVSYNRTDTKDASTACAYVFKINEKGKLAADAYMVNWDMLDEKGRALIDLENKVPSALTPVTEANNSKGSAFNHIKDIINSSMAMGLFVPGQKFYQSKAGGPIVVDWDGDQIKGVAGSFQYERGYYIPVIESFDKSLQGNGRSYIIDEEPLQSTKLSPFAAITDSTRTEFRAFASLLEGCSFIGTDDHASHTTMDNSLTNLSNYHYTIYVPKSESIEQLIAEHKLPTSDDRDMIAQTLAVLEDQIDAIDEEEAKENEDQVTLDKLAELQADKEFLLKQDTIMTETMENFVSYHIQDNSIYVDHVPEDSMSVFESACLDTATTRFAKIYVKQTKGGEVILTDNNGKTHKVDPTVNNILTRQYYFNGNNLKGNSCTEIYSSSYAVIHLIDSPMMPFKDNDPKHPDNGYYNPTTYKKVEALVAKYPLPTVDDVVPPVTETSNKVKRHKR